MGLIASRVFAAEPGCRSIYFDYPQLGHRFYDYVDRTQARGDLPLQSHIRPYFQFHFDSVNSVGFSDKESRRFRSESLSRHLIAEGRIKPVCESGWSRFLKKVGIRNRRGLRWLYSTNHHFAALHLEEKFALTYQPVYGIEGIWTDSEAQGIRRSGAGFRLEGGAAGALHFMVDFRDYGESGRGPYTAREQLYEDRWAFVDLKDKATSVSYNVSESFIQWYGRNMSLSLGRGRHAWGPGRFGQLFLSAEGPPFDYVRFDAVFRGKDGPVLNYTFLHAFLKAYGVPGDTLYIAPSGRPRTIDRQKFLSAQRIELKALPNLLLGFSQGVVYGDRNVELAYITPVSFLYSIEHAEGDKDNLLVAFDATWRPFRGLMTYGELLWDDMAIAEFGSDDARNKSAFTLGIHAAPRGTWRFLDARAEYTQVRPFVYSHVFATNVYTHWTSPLGLTLEPNSEFMTTELRATFYPVQFGLRWQRQNHGANSSAGEYNNVGGSIYAPLTGSPDSTYPLLEGDFHRTDRYSLWAVLELLENFLVQGRITRVAETGVEERVETALALSWNF